MTSFRTLRQASWLNCVSRDWVSGEQGTHTLESVCQYLCGVATRRNWREEGTVHFIVALRLKYQTSNTARSRASATRASLQRTASSKGGLLLESTSPRWYEGVALR